MMTRLALLDMVERLQLDNKQASILWRLAGFECEPRRQLPPRMRLGVTLLGISFVGLGLIFWIAANWNLLSRLQQFALLQCLVLAPCAAVAALARGQVPFGLFSLFATGSLFAYFGQTYQTGADLWQLFAAWAAVVLPLALCARSDAVWAAWTIVALTGVTLWRDANSASIGFSATLAHDIHVIAAACSAGLTVLLSKIGRRYTGAGKWTFGIAVVQTAILTTTAAVSDVFDSPSYYYWFCLILTGSAAAGLAYLKPFNVFAASVVGLALNVLVFAGLAAMLLRGVSNNWLGPLLLLSVAAALMLAATVKAIVVLARADMPRGETT